MAKFCSNLITFAIFFAIYGRQSLSLIDLTRQNHKIIPHDIISTDETDIRLTRNKLTTLGDGEFSNYPKLINCYVNVNLISHVSATAFTGTSLRLLHLARNRLAQFPDLRVVSASFAKLYIQSNSISVIPQELVDNMQALRYINIMWNPLVAIPDFTNVGSKHIHLVLNRIT